MLDKESNIEIVGEASNGGDVLEFLEKNHKNVDVILMDITLEEELSGIEITKQICKKYPAIKVLSLTMHAEDNYITNMIEAGARGYILKESGKDELVKAINTVSEGKKYFSNDVSVTLINHMMNGSKTKNDDLSRREVEVLRLIALGKTNREAGEELCVSSRTVETHRRNILSKLDCKNTAEMIHYAFKNKIVG